MSVVLNKKQLKHISNLIEMKGVKYYDVNMELTDHMASEVEAILEKGDLTYMQAVKKAFLRYNRFHFMKIEEEKEKKVSKQANKLFWKSLVQFFTFPKLVITAMVFGLSLLLVRYFNFNIIVITSLLIALVFGVVLDHKKRKALGRKTFLQLRALTPRYLMLLWIPFNAFNANKYIAHLGNEPLLIQSLIVTIVVLICTVVIETHNKHINTLKLQYA